MTVQIDPEFVLWSAPERERAGRPLLVLLHGYGSHEGDLFALAPRLPLAPVIASLRAPIRESAGYAWFTMTLQLIRHAPDRFAATVALSGFIASGGHPGDAALEAGKPPVFWGRGTADRVIAQDAVDRTAVWLPAHSTETTRIYEGLAHGISPEEFVDVNHFLLRYSG